VVAVLSFVGAPPIWGGTMWRTWTPRRASTQCADSSGLVKISKPLSSNKFSLAGWFVHAPEAFRNLEECACLQVIEVFLGKKF